MFDELEKLSMAEAMKDKIYIDESTKNKGFLKFCEKHETLAGIRTKSVLLRLVDTNLIGVDPYDESLDDDTKRRILAECIANPIYMLREILRDNKGEYFNMNMGNFMVLYLSLRGISVYAHMTKFATQRDDFCRALVKTGMVSRFGRLPFVIVTLDPQDAIANYALPNISAFADLWEPNIHFVHPSEIESVKQFTAKFGLVGAIVEDAGEIENLTEVLDVLCPTILAYNRISSQHSGLVDFDKGHCPFNIFRNCIVYGDLGSGDREPLNKLLSSKTILNGKTIRQYTEKNPLNDYIGSMMNRMILVNFDIMELALYTNGVTQFVDDLTLQIFPDGNIKCDGDTSAEFKRRFMRDIMTKLLLVDIYELDISLKLCLTDYIMRKYNNDVRYRIQGTVKIKEHQPF